MKKISCILFVLLLTVGMLVGCGESLGQSNSGNNGYVDNDAPPSDPRIGISIDNKINVPNGRYQLEIYDSNHVLDFIDQSKVVYSIYGSNVANATIYDGNYISATGIGEVVVKAEYTYGGETYTAYEDITAVEIYHRYDGDNELTLGYTVTLSDGKTFDMVPNDLFNRDIYKLHKMFEKKAQCTPKITPLTDEVRDELKEYMSPERLEEIEYVFEGFHK